MSQSSRSAWIGSERSTNANQMRIRLAFAFLVILLTTAFAETRQDYSLTVHVTSFEFNGLVYRVEAAEQGQTYILSASSVRRFSLEPGKSYPARRAFHNHRDEFQIVTPDVKGHWFEIDGTKKP
jgi:hypothetical protein